MPQQEVFFEQKAGDIRVEVLKTYDRNFAHEAFLSMDNTAQNYLWSSLRLDEHYDAADVQQRNSTEAEDFLWEELLDAAREDGNQLSFFVVTQCQGTDSRSLFVSPDWPSAEEFAKRQTCLM